MKSKGGQVYVYDELYISRVHLKCANINKSHFK